MSEFFVSDIIKACGGKLLCGSADTVINSVTIDSRKSEKNTLFVPLKGENTDGHAYIDSALANGCVASLTQVEKQYDTEKCIILVDDTKQALGELGKYYRESFGVPFVAITGSVGKTSTKDMVSSVLDTAFSVHKTQGNYNNDLGVPLTLLAMPKDSDMAVIEMGMSGFGEIDYLASLAKPDVAIITNIGISHIEKLGSQENIMKAKLEVLNHLADDGLVILNGDDPLLCSLKGSLSFETVYYSINNKDCDFVAYDIESDDTSTKFSVDIDGKKCDFKVGFLGIHNVYNALCAIVCALKYNIGYEKIKEGIANFVPSGMRMKEVISDGVKYIVDCYNASPDSCKASVDTLMNTPTVGRRICVFGDMLELGNFAEKAHFQTGEMVAKSGVDVLICAGENAKFIAAGAMESGMKEVLITKDALCAKPMLAQTVKEGDTVVVKGSRGMTMEKALPFTL